MQLEKDWRTRLAEAEKRGYFSRDDKVKIGSFDTCFIGEHYDLTTFCATILTSEQKELGLQACRAIYSNNIAQAKEIYGKVQKLYE